MAELDKNEMGRLEKLADEAAFDPSPSRYQPVSPSDVVIATYCKAGTTWTQQLVHQLRSGGDMSFGEIHEAIPFLPFGRIEPHLSLTAPQAWAPHCIKSHDTWETVPKGCRYIYVAREPVANFYSLYLHTHDMLALERGVSIERFYDAYEGHVRTVWNHHASWWPHRNDAHLLWLHYEDLQDNLPQCIDRLASFLHIDLTPDLKSLVLERGSFGYMKAHANQFDGHLQRSHESSTWQSPTDRVDIKYGKVRSGIRGEAQSRLSDRIRLRIEQAWKERMQEFGLDNYNQMRAEQEST